MADQRVRTRVLHVAQPVAEGVPTSVGYLVRHQVESGFDVTVACPQASSLTSTAVEAGARHVAWDARREPDASVIAEARQLARIAGEIEPDVVHLHSSKAGLAGRLAVRGRTPTIFQPRGWSFEAVTGPTQAVARAWERFAARWTSMIVCVSRTEQHRGVQVGIRASWSVIANGVDLQKFRPATDADRARARERLGLDACPLVVCLGRLSRQKGQDVLLRAWPAVLERVPEARAILIGDGPERSALMRLSAPRVTLAGRRSDAPDWLAASDVVALPSRWEGMSLAMLEAMASARSIVASDVAGVREVIGDDAGAVVPVGNPRALADALAERLLDRQLARAEGRIARDRVAAHHDVRNTTEAIAELYARLSSSRPR